MDVIIAGTVLWVLSLFALRGFWRPAALHKWPVAAHRRTPPEQDPIDAILDLAIDEDLTGC
jgi:hypothetical protein